MSFKEYVFRLAISSTCFLLGLLLVIAIIGVGVKGIFSAQETLSLLLVVSTCLSGAVGVPVIVKFLNKKTLKLFNLDEFDFDEFNGSKSI